MFHARADYQSRIQDSAGLIPAREPVFLIRGQDKAAIPAAEAWCAAAEAEGLIPPSSSWSETTSRGCANGRPCTEARFPTFRRVCCNPPTPEVDDEPIACGA